MHALAVGHHPAVPTSVRKHLVSLASVCSIIHHVVLLFSVVCLLGTTLGLAFDIHWRVRSDSVLRRS